MQKQYQAAILVLGVLAALSLSLSLPAFHSASIAAPAKAKPAAATNGVINVLDYGAVGDDKTDNTEAFSACLDDIIKAGGGKMFIPRGIYRGRIIIPGARQWLTIEIEGEAEPTPIFGTIGAFAYANTGTVIKCLDQEGPAVIQALSEPGRIYSHFSGVYACIRNIEARTYDNPAISGIDLHNAAQCKLENVFVNTGIYNVRAAKPTHGTSGIVTPANSNAALTVLRNVVVSGYHNGIVVHEHTDADNIVVASNTNGLHFKFAHHASRFARVGTYRNSQHITISGRHGFSIEQMNTEMPGEGQTDSVNAWQTLVADVNDPNNLGAGNINYWVVLGGKGAVDQFIKNGGAGIHARRIGSID
jgi:hypothetical protein